MDCISNQPASKLKLEMIRTFICGSALKVESTKSFYNDKKLAQTELIE